MIALSDRAFIISFAELKRWDPGSYHGISWHWPAEDMKPLGSVLRQRKEKVDRKKHNFADLQPVTIHFDGSVDRRKVDANREYTMDLFFARPGDVVAAKIDLKNGAVGVIPLEWENVVVTNHFAVYEPDLTQVLPHYLHLIIQLPFFKSYLWRNKVGAEGRKEVKLNFFEAVKIPIPPLDVQQAIVTHWQQARQEVVCIRQNVSELTANLQTRFLYDLGLAAGTSTARPKAFAVMWKDLFQWSGRATFLLTQATGLKSSVYPLVTGRDCLTEVRHGCGASPSLKPTALDVLKISAVTRGHFLPSERKPMFDKQTFREQFALKAGDILMCRTNGTLAYVGMAALVTEQEDVANLIFPDKVIRVRAKDNILPEYLWHILKSRPVRTQIEAAARTAVGNYAIGTEDIWNLQIPLPPLEVQAEIVQRVGEGRAEIACERHRADERERTARAEVEAMILGTLRTL